LPAESVLAKFQGRRKKQHGREWVKHGWSNNRKGGRDGGGKERLAVASTPSEVPSNFSAVMIAPI